MFFLKPLMTHAYRYVENYNHGFLKIIVMDWLFLSDGKHGKENK